MNLRAFFLLPLFLCSLFFSTAASFASPSDAEARLQAAINQILQAAKSAPDSNALAKSIRPILEKHLSFDRMTQMAVGPGWRSFSKEEKQKAVLDFTTLIIRTYGDKLTPGELPVIEFKSAKQTGQGRVEIPTTLRYKGSQYEVTYRMQNLEDWKVTDVVIEGVSFVANYRSQFDALFKKGGASSVLHSLNQSVNR